MGMMGFVHEWALADAVVETVLKALDGRPPGTLRAVEILVGELQSADVGILEFALKTLLEERGIDPGAVRLEREKAGMRCRACGREWSLDGDSGLDAGALEAVHFLPESIHAFSRCPACGSADFSVEKGRGVSISRLLLAEAGETRP